MRQDEMHVLAGYPGALQEDATSPSSRPTATTFLNNCRSLLRYLLLNLGVSIWFLLRHYFFKSACLFIARSSCCSPRSNFSCGTIIGSMPFRALSALNLPGNGSLLFCFAIVRLSPWKCLCNLFGKIVAFVQAVVLRCCTPLNALAVDYLVVWMRGLNSLYGSAF